jgi:asparagine synthase (glutamine-hydrolysing)
MGSINGIYTYKNLECNADALGRMLFRSETGEISAHVKYNQIVLGQIGDSDIDNHHLITSKSGRYTILFDGEIYNANDLREELARKTVMGPGVIFTGETNAELVLEAFVIYGKACLSRLNGVFSFSVWDEEKKELFIARDRLGIRPLYYFKDDDKLIFSSELKSILKSELIDKRISHKGLTDFLRYTTVHAPQTIIEGVRVLLPGHYLIINEEDFTIRKYWDMVEEAGKEFVPSDDNILKDKIRTLVLDSVKSLLPQDKPVALLLSNTVDSIALLTAVTQVSNFPIHIFSIDDGGFYANYFKEFADKSGNSFSTVKFDKHLFTSKFLESLFSYDIPTEFIPETLMIADNLKKNGFNSVISNIGAPEIFAGYSIFKEMYQYRDMRWLLSFPVFARNFVGRVLKTIKPGSDSAKKAEILVRDYFDISDVYPFYRQVLLDKQVFKILNNNLLESNRVREISNQSIDFGTPGFNLPYLSKISIVEIFSRLQNSVLKNVNQIRNSNGINITLPFLNHNLVRFVLAIEDKNKYPDSEQKLLMDAFEGLIPRDLEIPMSEKTSISLEDMIKNDLKSFCSEHLLSFGKRSQINSKEIQNLWNLFLKEGSSTSYKQIWHLVVLEQWLQTNRVN